MKKSTEDLTVNAGLHTAIRARDHLGVRRALKNGGSVYTPLPGAAPTYRYPLDGVLHGIASHDKIEDFTPLASEILAAEKPGMPLPGHSKFLAKALSVWGLEGLEWVLSFKGNSVELPLVRSTVMGVSHSLFDIAVRFGHEDAALELWDRYQAGPQSAGPDIPTHASALGLVFRRIKFPEKLWARLLEEPWDNEDLDEALSESLKRGNIEATRQLLKKGASPNRRHVLHGAESTSELSRRIASLTQPTASELFSLLVEHGSRLDEEVAYDVTSSGTIQYLQSPKGRTKVSHNNVQILGLAASSGRVKDVKEILSLGADVNHQSLEGDTPLHLAASGASESRQGDIMEIASLLIEAGADILAVNKKGHTPIEEWASHLPLTSGWNPVSYGALEIAHEWMAKTLCADPNVGHRVAGILKNNAHPLGQSALKSLHAWKMEAHIPSPSGKQAPQVPKRF